MTAGRLRGLMDVGARLCLLGHALTVAAVVLTFACVLATGHGHGDAVLAARVAAATGLSLGLPGVVMAMVRDAIWSVPG